MNPSNFLIHYLISKSKDKEVKDKSNTELLMSSSTNPLLNYLIIHNNNKNKEAKSSSFDFEKTISQDNLINELNNYITVLETEIKKLKSTVSIEKKSIIDFYKTLDKSELKELSFKALDYEDNLKLQNISKKIFQTNSSSDDDIQKLITHLDTELNTLRLKNEIAIMENNKNEIIAMQKHKNISKLSANDLNLILELNTIIQVNSSYEKLLNNLKNSKSTSLKISNSSNYIADIIKELKAKLKAIE